MGDDPSLANFVKDAALIAAVITCVLLGASTAAKARRTQRLAVGCALLALGGTVGYLVGALGLLPALAGVVLLVATWRAPR